ncbi:TonB family protein [Azonexus sp. IMCC34839]|uniref:energy transducer TonB n=1 Tax=Azonexus sp. IMCC34839 TaxID=3133695 RepID=UPI00399B6589
MNAACLQDIPTPPEWQRSGRFLLLAAALHGAVLFYPLQLAIGKLEIPLPQTLSVQLLNPAPMPVAPKPIAQPPANEPQPQKAKPQPAHRPILAMPTSAPSEPNSFKVPEQPATPPVVAAAPAAVTAPAAPGPAAPVSAARFDAAYLHNPEPKYPPLSRRLGEEGKVLLKVRVTSEGLAAAVDLEKSSNFERLDEAAKQTVARWRFVPAKRGDQPIEASVIVPIVFRLEG